MKSNMQQDAHHADSQNEQEQSDHISESKHQTQVSTPTFMTLEEEKEQFPNNGKYEWNRNWF